MDEQTPEAVSALIDEVTREVVDAYDVVPDLTPETLPLVDQLLRDQVSQLSAAARADRLAAIGAYFGEVMRRHLDGRWVLAGPPTAWRVELIGCFLHFSPVGMAGEVLAGCEVETYDGTFSTLNELHEELHEMLAAATPLAEDEYFSLAGRAEVLELVADWLIGRRLASDEARPLRKFTAEDYAERIDDPHHGMFPD